MKRITISLDDDLRAMVRAHAVGSGMSMSKAVSDLLRRTVGRTSPSSMGQGKEPEVSPLTGFRLSRGDRRIGPDDVRRAMEAEDLRYVERATGKAPPSGGR